MSETPTTKYQSDTTRQATQDLNATSKSGDVWTGEIQDGFYLYRDANRNLYESLEQPAYRIVMDNAQMTNSGICPIRPMQRPRDLDIDPHVANFVDSICKLGDGAISKFADKIIANG